MTHRVSLLLALAILASLTAGCRSTGGGDGVRGTTSPTAANQTAAELDEDDDLEWDFDDDG